MHRTRSSLLLALFAAPGLCAAAPQQAPSLPAPQPAQEQPTVNYYVEARSTGTRRDTEPPRYVRNLGSAEWLREGADLGWLDLGLDYRLRAEYRDDDLRRPTDGLDRPYLQRWRGYLGIHDRFDPLRLYLEYEDAFRNNSAYPTDSRDVNRQEIIQGVLELYFGNALGHDRPVRLQAGRMAFEYVDRRLIARNEWRNTTNNFQGFRAILGQQSNDWQLDVLALKPVERRTEEPDVAVDNQWFYGLIGDWRRWSSVVTLQPYYLLLKQQQDGAALDRDIHTVGLRGYGLIGKSGFDYDLQGITQFGDDGPRDHHAVGATGELGYTFKGDWKPRLGAFLGYASGDEDPTDGSNEHFDKLFGFARPWSANDYITFENVIAPKARLDFQPHSKLRVDLGYSAYWLASDTDRWAGANNLRDPSGQSGSFMGQELDVRARIKVSERLDVTIGYAYFLPGEFTSNVGRDQDTDFFYVEISPRFLP